MSYEICLAAWLKIMAIKKLGILVGGGPAPGINGVISAVALEAIRLGCAPIGFHDGFEWLAERYTDEQHELTVDEMSRIHLDGGSMLGTSRTDVARATGYVSAPMIAAPLPVSCAR